MRTKKKILTMVIVIIILQGVLPLLGILFENSFTIISKGTTEWDISQNGDGTVKAILDEETGTLTIEGTGAMKNWSSSSSVPWNSVRETIQKVIIKEGVTSIGNSTFNGCSGLMSIEIPSSVTSIESYAFNGCSSLTSIELPNSVTSIGGGALSGCSSLTSINIPEGVTSIGSYAFYNCSSLTSIDIPEGVTSIGSEAFHGCSSLTSISVNENNKNYSSENGVLFNKEKTSIICYPAGKQDTTYTVPSSVTSIGSSAFAYCSSLTSINIPEGVASIGGYAFAYCSSLTSIKIPEGVTSIGGYTFYRCSSLTSINIPEGVTSIESYAFYKCSSLTSIEIPSSVTSIGSDAFYNCSSLTSIEILSSVTRIESSVFEGCSSLTSIEIPSSVTSIGERAFMNCSSLLRIEIPEGVTSIGSSAFYNCSSVTSIELPSSVTSIGTYAFKYCSSLTSIKIPEGVTSIGSDAFYGCSSLTIYCRSNSYTKEYAENNSIKYSEVNPEITSVTGNPENWTKDDVTLTITAQDDLYGLASEPYSFDGGTTWQKENTKVYSQNTNGIIIKVKCKDGAIETYETINITKIDKEAPTIEEVEGNPSNWTKEDVTLTITGAKDTLSGLASEAYSFDGGATWQKENTKVYSQNTEGIVIKVKDNLGNTYTHGTINITKIDKDAPTIEKVEGNPSNWTKEDVTLTITGAKDILSGLASEPYSFDGGATWQKENTKVYSQNTEGIVIKVKDSLGNTYTHETINITKIDREAPTIEGVEGNPSDWTKEDVILTITGAKDILSGLASEPYSFDGGVTWQKENTKVYSQNTEGIVIKVKDNLGNTYTHETINITKIMKPESIKVTTLPTKTTYHPEENFDKTGMVVTLVYDNKMEEEITNYTVLNGTNLKYGEQKITIQYNENTKIKTEIPITVSHIEVIDEAVEATCTETGLTEGKHCSVCGEVIVAQKTVPAKGHTWQEIETIEPTCLKEGSIESECSVCGETQIIPVPAKGHTWQEIETIEPTCLKEGSIESECSVCGETQIIPVPALGHSFTNYVSNNDATCAKDGTKTAKCDRCEETETITDEGSKKPHTEVIDKAVEATCTETGLTEGKHCSVCNEVIVAQETVPAKGHTEVIDQAIAPTCTETGLTEGKHCSVCNTVIKAQETVPAKGHTEVIDKAIAPTCTEAGLTEGKHCSVCNTVITAQTTVPAKGHTEVIDEAVTPTCTETGLTEGKHCSVCNTVIKAQTTVPALGHSYENGECIRCGEEEPKVTVSSDEYEIDTSKLYITNIQSETTMENFKKKIDTTQGTEIKVYKDNVLVTDSSFIATGMVIKLKNGEKEATFTLIVSGDVDKNGSVDFWDMIEINQHRLGIKPLDDVSITAGDVDETDNEFGFWDIIKINEYRLKKITKI